VVQRLPDGLASRRGITLLELVMVMLVAAVLFGLTLPVLSALAGRFKVGSARDVFINTYARARVAAVQFGREGRLHIRADQALFWVEVDTGVPGAVAADTIGHIVDVRREYGGVTMFSPRQTLCFAARGLAYSGGTCEPHDAIIVFSRLDRADTVQLSLGGTVVRRQ
jgi:type II secretory pathway pseudopilin PulG